ncbi:hypothetical protein D3C75_956090 [compost metagenome]
MGADRGINAARAVQFSVGNFAHHLIIKRLAHAVQALEFVLARVVVLPGEVVNGRQRVGVVGRKLRVNQVRYGQQFFGAGQI